MIICSDTTVHTSSFTNSLKAYDFFNHSNTTNRDCVVSIVTSLHNGRSGFRIPAGVKMSLLQDVQSDTGHHPTCYSMGTGAFSQGYDGRGLKLTTHLHLNEWSYTPAPPICLHSVQRDNFTFSPQRYLS
jgi:hypothetical protein